MRVTGARLIRLLSSFRTCASFIVLADHDVSAALPGLPNNWLPISSTPFANTANIDNGCTPGNDPGNDPSDDDDRDGPGNDDRM
jgi:hypothetical protein